MAEIYSFGVWVRQRRKALDLTQIELAQRVGCAESMLRKIEADARRPSRQLAAQLATALDLPDGEHDLFCKAARAELAVGRLGAPAFAPQPDEGQRAEASPQHNLPAPLTPLIGRAAECAALRALIVRPDVRLATLVGAPGVGKTRLALAAAQALLPHFPDGVWLVALAAIVEPAQVGAAIAHALGVNERGGHTPEAALKAHLRDKALLLVLDNFEHLLPAAVLVADLLAASARLTILVTSRTPLHVRAERQFALAPLGLPDTAQLGDLDAVAQAPSVALFVARAQAVAHDFALRADNAAHVAAVCAQLEGLPLAIELAAARSAIFTPKALLAQLDHRLAMLTNGPRDAPERQRTLRAALDWSHALLAPDEQALFAQLGRSWAAARWKRSSPFPTRRSTPRATRSTSSRRWLTTA